MNSIADEIKIILDESDELKHYGTPRHSGRYPYGSGKDPYQRTRDLIGRIEQLKKEGWTETPENIKKEFGLTTDQYRAQKGLGNSLRRMDEVARAKSLKEDGLNNSEIGRQMGKSESTIRSLLNPESEKKMMQAKNTADFIRKQIDEKGMIEVGSGVERELGISREKMKQALLILESEGYVKYGGGAPQPTNPGQQTNMTVICPPGTKHKDIYNYENIHSLNEYTSHDGGETFTKFVYPKSMDSKRLMVRYAEDGGIDKDGIIELRRGVEDLSLGNSHYSQVRILVDNDRYLKGMAVYSDAKDWPDGVDVVFNTNKTKDKAMRDVLKDANKNLAKDPDNPFGSTIKPNGQDYYDDPKGKYTNPITGKKQSLSLVNKTRDEADWSEWKDTLPSQFLSKQSLNMAKKQLKLAEMDKLAEFDEYKSLNNPTVKKHLLSKFADECDAAAVHLKAAALPGQKYHVIIPINSLKDNEVYAPGYEPGTKLALIRYPHGGTFEIPILTVNNKNTIAKKLIGNQSMDAVGINKNIADRLSGADFDGDTVMCIPTHDKAGKVKITSTPPLKGLEGFDPKMEYPEKPGMKYMRNTGTQMGIVSNLITDMTLKGATSDELARAVRHSMVVIDAEKHKLDYKQSELDNGISSLKKKYQSYVDDDGNVHSGGASTLISRAKGQQSVTKRQGTPQINTKGKPWYDPTKPEGSLLYKNADDAEYTVTKINKRTGEVTTTVQTRKQKSTKMAETDDASKLISDADTPMERAYADYANHMKALANQARKEMVSTGKIAYSSTAKATYQPEVKSLMDKLNIAELNRPKERMAVIRTNAEVNAKKKAYKEANGVDMKPADLKKLNQQTLSKYRNEVGSVSRKDRSIKLTDREWEAIQAGAISENVLKKILNNADIDDLRQRATPRTSNSLSTAQVNRIKSLAASNYTLDEIARKMGKSTSTISKYLKGAS